MTNDADARTTWERLRDPFPPEDIEWMIQGTPVKKGSRIIARCFAYVTNRAIQQRLDDVVGADKWRNEYRDVPNSNGKGAALCGLSILVDGEWVTKWDGAENTDIEAVKGGLSNSMKRAGAQWGIGRYLYFLPDGWIVHRKGGRYNEWRKVRVKGGAKDGDETPQQFNWDPPDMPIWALPGGGGRPPPDQIRPDGSIANSQIMCPLCEAPLNDFRAEKTGGPLTDRRPDLACSNQKCADPNTDKPWAAWLDTWSDALLAEIEAAHGAGLMDAHERTKAEEVVHAGEDIERMVRIQAWVYELTTGAGGELPEGSDE